MRSRRILRNQKNKRKTILSLRGKKVNKKITRRLNRKRTKKFKSRSKYGGADQAKKHPVLENKCLAHYMGNMSNKKRDYFALSEILNGELQKFVKNDEGDKYYVYYIEKHPARDPDTMYPRIIFHNCKNGIEIIIPVSDFINAHDKLKLKDGSFEYSGVTYTFYENDEDKVSKKTYSEFIKKIIEVHTSPDSDKDTIHPSNNCIGNITTIYFKEYHRIDKKKQKPK